MNFDFAFRRSSGSSRTRLARSSAPIFESLEQRAMLSTSWYVSAAAGSDKNPGTLALPFATIQHAASLAEPGDTVLISAGVYHETVTPAHSGTAAAPITYEPYNGASVEVDGANAITGWTLDSGSIYQATQTYDLGDGNNQVFASGKMLSDASFPNTSSNPMSPATLSATTATPTVATTGLSTCTITNALLNEPAGYWVGATIHIAPGQGWVWQTGTVTASTGTSITYTYQQLTTYQVPGAGNPFYLTGKLSMLNAPGEFYHNPANNTLYVWAPAGGAPTNVESKARPYAFDLSGLSYVNVAGLAINAATINTSATSSHLNLSYLAATYVSQQQDNADPWLNKYSPHTTGIILNGTYNTLSDSSVNYSSGDGVFLGGSNNTVVNTTITNVDYSGGDDAGVSILGASDTVEHDVIASTGRSGVTFYFSTKMQILNDVIHDVGLRTSDCGGIYAWNTNGAGSEISHNIVYDAYSGGYGNTGIFLDNNCQYMSVDHNIVYNADAALKMNGASVSDYVFNNDFSAGVNPNHSLYPKPSFSAPSAFIAGSTPTFTTTALINDIFIGIYQFPKGLIQNNNLFSASAAKFVNAATGNFQLQTGSAAIDAGEVLVPYTNGYLGAAPDIGAYEFGAAPFLAGLYTPISAFTPIHAETFDSSQGVTIQPPGIGSCDNGDWVEYSSVNFGAGANTFTANLAVLAQYAGQKIEIHVDGLTGPILGTLTVANTGGWATFVSQSISITPISGIHDVYLIFRGKFGVCNLNWFDFSESVGAKK